MKQKTILFILSLVSFISPSYSFSENVIDLPQITDQINTQIQVQNNGWIKILDHYVESKPYEEWNREIELDYPLIKEENKLIRDLYISIQFLKACTATKKGSGFEEEDDTSFDESSQEFREESQYDDYMFYKFNCDYRNKVFVTFFTKDGKGIETRGEYPVAKLVDENSKWYTLDAQMYQTHMLPGETTSIKFSQIPENAAHWYIWLFK